ncbi:unnamed protein product [Arctogadus glacialis]
MPGEDSQPPQARQRKRKGRSSKAKGRPPPLGAPDGEGPLMAPSVLAAPSRGPQAGLQVRMEEESSRAVCLQVLLPFLLAGMGMVSAGMVLDSVQPGILLSSETSSTCWSWVNGDEEEDLLSAWRVPLNQTEDLLGPPRTPR